MKNTFKEFVRPKTEELRNLWNRAVIVLDTNVLLNLYAYSEKTRNEVFKILEKLKKQLWLPYKVCEEFYIKRISIIDKANHSNDKIISDIEDLLKIDEESCLYSLLHENKYLKKLKDEARKILNKNKLDIFHDDIVDKLENIYDKRVGKDFNKEEKNNIEEEYRYKVKNDIYCPGYKDSNKDNNSSGDLILWRQILDHAKKNKVDIIFVTEDEKNDWWWKPRDIRISARYELLKEFIESTDGKSFYMYNFKDFTKDFTKYKNVEIDKDVTDEINQIMKRLLSEEKELHLHSYIDLNSKEMDLGDLIKFYLHKKNLKNSISHRFVCNESDRLGSKPLRDYIYEQSDTIKKILSAVSEGEKESELIKENYDKECS